MHERRWASTKRRVCFFFQAEDGIRDYDVTGVQTCALPIFGNRANQPVGILKHCLKRLAGPKQEGITAMRADDLHTKRHAVGVATGRHGQGRMAHHRDRCVDIAAPGPELVALRCFRFDQPGRGGRDFIQCIDRLRAARNDQ